MPTDQEMPATQATPEMARAPVKSVRLRDRAIDLHGEFIVYSAAATDERSGKSHFAHDTANGLQAGAHMAAGLGYKIVPLDRRFSCENDPYNPPEPTVTYIQQWFGPEKTSSLLASLGASQVTVVRVSTFERISFAMLARLEEIFGKLPRSRIVQSPFSFDIHMRGVTAASADSLGLGLTLLSGRKFVELPSTKGYSWLRIGELEPVPDWVLNPHPSKSAAKVAHE